MIEPTLIRIKTKEVLGPSVNGNDNMLDDSYYKFFSRIIEEVNRSLIVHNDKRLVSIQAIASVLDICNRGISTYLIMEPVEND